MSGFRVSCVHCGDQPAYIECDECGHQTNGVWPFDGECPNCGKPDGGYGCLSCEKWTRFDEMPDYQAKVPPDLDVAEFRVTCKHCDGSETTNMVVCQECHYTAENQFWPLDCKCPNCGKLQDGYHCGWCMELTPFDEMPDYLAQVSPSVEVTEPSEDVETSTIEIKRLPIMPLLVIIFICAAAVWFFSDKLEWLKPEIAEGTEQVSESYQAIAEQFRSMEVGQGAQVAKRTFRTLPVRPELSASIAEQADYVVESSAYWCGQLAQTLQSNSTSRVNDLLEELPVHLVAHRSTLDLCYAKIQASEVTIAEHLEGSPEVQRKRLRSIEAMNAELEAVEGYLAKCDILWDEVSAYYSRSASPPDSKLTQGWINQLEAQMAAASALLN